MASIDNQTSYGYIRGMSIKSEYGTDALGEVRRVLEPFAKAAAYFDRSWSEGSQIVSFPNETLVGGRDLCGLSLTVRDLRAARDLLARLTSPAPDGEAAGRQGSPSLAVRNRLRELVAARQKAVDEHDAKAASNLEQAIGQIIAWNPSVLAAAARAAALAQHLPQQEHAAPVNAWLHGGTRTGFRPAPSGEVQAPHEHDYFEGYCIYCAKPKPRPPQQEQVERVARAIHESECGIHWGDETDFHREEHRATARAAIAALRPAPSGALREERERCAQVAETCSVEGSFWRRDIAAAIRALSALPAQGEGKR
jgi:hypothetical protein